MTGSSSAVRPATDADLVAVMRLLDAAVLEADARVVGDRIDGDTDTVLVAEADSRVVGALVLDGSHIDAVAVQKERRGRGIGTDLVAAAAAHVDGGLTADFDEGVRPFYASLGFDIAPKETDEGRGRFRGRLRGTR
jgi:GNAT superfamily N-acetyltransferase